jgi:hypothetical protein
LAAGAAQDRLDELDERAGARYRAVHGYRDCLVVDVGVRERADQRENPVAAAGVQMARHGRGGAPNHVDGRIETRVAEGDVFDTQQLGDAVAAVLTRYEEAQPERARIAHLHARPHRIAPAPRLKHVHSHLVAAPLPTNGLGLKQRPGFVDHAQPARRGSPCLGRALPARLGVRGA